MEIQKQKRGEILAIYINGRLDAYWSDHLTNSIDESIHQGSHQIELNLARVDYLSSAGIRVLLKFYKQLKAIKGSLVVTQPSEGARAILAMAGLADILISNTTAAPVVVTPKKAGPERLERENAIYHVHSLAPGAALKCAVVGNPKELENGTFTECQNVPFPESTFGIGIGAFGANFADCRERFGEFLALEGAAAYLPTDGTNVPDYMISEGALVPEMKVLYALACQGRFASFIRFDAKPEPPGVVTMADLVESVLGVCKSDLVGFVMLAESAGLVGAALRRSPAMKAAGESPLAFPGVRDWLTFTAERSFDRTLCVVVGVAAREATAEGRAILRPIGLGTAAVGHFHAGVFPYRALQKGELNLRTEVNGLFAIESLLGLLHLLPDDREIVGTGQSEFLRGAIWAGPNWGVYDTMMKTPFSELCA